MANVIKYSTGNVSLESLRRGNTVLGIGNENYGPTSTTGFVNGVDVPDGGYVVYQLHSTSPAAYIANNDNELIAIARTLGNSGTTVASAKEYLANNSNTWILDVMPDDIVTEEIRLNVDTSIMTSYPGSGAEWNDMSGFNNNFPISNVDWTGRALLFNGVNSGAQSSISSYNPDSGDSTMCVVFKCDNLGAGEQAIFSDNYGPEYGLWIHTNGNLRFVAYASVYATIDEGRWYHAVLTIRPGANRSSTDQTYIQAYLNGNLVGESNANTGNGMNDQPFSFGFDYKSGNSSRWFNGEIAAAQVYYGRLTQDQVSQNYYGGPIVTRGIQQHYDFHNIICYDGVGGIPGAVDVYNMVTGEPAAIRNTNNGISFRQAQGYMRWDGTTTANINIPDTGGMAEFTLSVWVFNEQGGNSRHSILRNFWEIVGTSVAFWSYSFDNDYWRQSSSGLVPYNEWTHVTTSWDGERVRHYINGELVYTQPSPSGGTSESMYQIGGYSGRMFYGRIGILSIYEQCLSLEEISQNYNAHVSRFH